MKPLENCEICGGFGLELDRIEERGGVNVMMFEPCPCLDREEPLPEPWEDEPILL